MRQSGDSGEERNFALLGLISEFRETRGLEVA